MELVPGLGTALFAALQALSEALPLDNQREREPEVSRRPTIGANASLSVFSIVDLQIKVTRPESARITTLSPKSRLSYSTE